MVQKANIVPRKKKTAPYHIDAEFRDPHGPVARLHLTETSGTKVEIESEIAVGINPLMFAGLLLVLASHIFGEAAQSEELADAAQVLAKRAEALNNVRGMASNQKRLDHKDRGALDDWPKPDDSEIPF